MLGWEAIKPDVVRITVQKDPPEWRRGMGLEAGIPRVSVGAAASMAADTEDGIIQRGMYGDWPDVQQVGFRARPRFGLSSWALLPRRGVVSGGQPGHLSLATVSPRCPASHSRPPKFNTHTRSKLLQGVRHRAQIPRRQGTREQVLGSLGSLSMSEQEIPAGAAGPAHDSGMKITAAGRMV